MVDSALGVPDPRRVDSEDGPSPSADLGITPYLPHLVGRLQGDLGIDGGGVREDPLQHDQAARISRELGVLPPGAI